MLPADASDRDVTALKTLMKLAMFFHLREEFAGEDMCGEDDEDNKPTDKKKED